MRYRGVPGCRRVRVHPFRSFIHVSKYLQRMFLFLIAFAAKDSSQAKVSHIILLFRIDFAPIIEFYPWPVER
jgi:hypothetical protein